MSPPSEHERQAHFLRQYAESELALYTFVRSLVPRRQMASEVMLDVILVGSFRACPFVVDGGDA